MNADIVVVGAGVLGKSIAVELAQAGCRTICVGASHQSPGTASSAAGAMLGVLGEVTAEQLDSQSAHELAFRADAAAVYPAFLEAVADASSTCVQIEPGTYVIANLVNKADRKNLRAIRAAAAELALPCETVDPCDVPGLKPSRHYEAIEAVFLEREGRIDAPALLDALDKAVDLLPAAVQRQAFVTRLLTHGDDIAGIELDDNAKVLAPVVVLANGIGVGQLLGSTSNLPVRLPRLIGGKGVGVTVRAPDILVPYVLRTPNRDFACGTHIVPRVDNALYIGATNRVADSPGSSGITPGELHALMHSAIHEINVDLRTTEIVRFAYGMRPLTGDGAPLIGPLGPGLFVATGTYRNGILMAPLIAKIVAAEISGTSFRDHPFNPSRSARMAQPTPLAILDRGLRDVLSFALEPAGQMPYDREAEMERLLTWLGRLAFDESDESDCGRREVLDRLADSPTAETIAQIYYELSAESGSGDALDDNVIPHGE